MAGEITAKSNSGYPRHRRQEPFKKPAMRLNMRLEVITHDQSTDIAEAVGGDKTASPQQGGW